MDNDPMKLNKSPDPERVLTERDEPEREQTLADELAQMEGHMPHTVSLLRKAAKYFDK